MVISNAKYERKHNGGRSRKVHGEDDFEAVKGIEFEIPRYEELTFLRFDLAEE
ncbi:MAG TPA: hypothetical protein V6C99_03170 [Oculatellaceae cyanobacterium]|jgi:hypothetical protein